MNSRERVLAAMRGHPVDRIPFTPNLNGYNLVSMPERFQKMKRWDVYRNLGLDLFIRFRVGARIRPPMILLPPPAAGCEATAGSFQREYARSMPISDKIKVHVESRDGIQYVYEETPVGTLRWGWKNTPECPDFPFPTEHPIKTIEDLRTYRFILDHTVVEPAGEDIEETLAAVGDEGTCEAAGSPTPIQSAIELLMGMETFYAFLLVEHPQETVGLLEQMMEINRMEYAVLAKCAAPVIVTGENTSTTLSSPALMARYEFPALDEFSDILHRENKIHMVHMCGRVHLITDLIAGAKFDGIEDVAPPPTGDFDFRGDFARIRAGGKSLSGGIDCTAFAQLSVGELEQYVINRLADVAPGKGFLLGAGDTVPFGTSEEKLRTVVRVVQEYGKYPTTSE